MKSKLEISYRKTPQGAWELSTVTCGRRVHLVLFGYTKRIATKLFREYCKALKA